MCMRSMRTVLGSRMFVGWPEFMKVRPSVFGWALHALLLGCGQGGGGLLYTRDLTFSS